MAIRELLYYPDEHLHLSSAPVTEFDESLADLVSDMFETMYHANGVGLAAPQVGVLRQIFVVDIGDGKRFVCINPEVTPVGDEVQTGEEGCLSVPNKEGIVTRAMKVHVKALDINMEPYEFDAEGLLARAMQHENDHLAGIMYTSLVEGELEDVEYEALEEADWEE